MRTAVCGTMTTVIILEQIVRRDLARSNIRVSKQSLREFLFGVVVDVVVLAVFRLRQWSVAEVEEGPFAREIRRSDLHAVRTGGRQLEAGGVRRTVRLLETVVDRALVVGVIVGRERIRRRGQHVRSAAIVQMR